MDEKPANAEEVRQRLDEALDEALADSFPASDPPAIDRPHPAQQPKDRK